MQIRGLTSNLLLAALAVGNAALVGEVALRVLTPFPITRESNRIPHPELVHTADPALEEIDDRGFRNPTPTAERYDVVAIGDSHTYGVNAQPSGSWPAQLGLAHEIDVYNFGMGGYSIYQYDVLFDKAMSFDPHWVVVAIYPANDFVANCDMVGLEGWAASQADGGCADEEGRLESKSTMGDRLRGLALISAIDKLIWEPLRYGVLASGDLAAPTELFELEVDGRRLGFGRARAQGHARATDMSTDRVARGYKRGLEFIARWRAQSERLGIGLGIVILPSRERVLSEWVSGRGIPVPEELTTLTRNERDLAGELMGYLERLGVPARDATQHTVAAFDVEIAAGRSLYPAGPDGHPFAAGYAAYASAVAELIATDDSLVPKSRSSTAR